MVFAIERLKKKKTRKCFFLENSSLYLIQRMRQTFLNFVAFRQKFDRFENLRKRKVRVDDEGKVSSLTDVDRSSMFSRFNRTSKFLNVIGKIQSLIRFASLRTVRRRKDSPRPRASSSKNWFPCWICESLKRKTFFSRRETNEKLQTYTAAHKSAQVVTVRRRTPNECRRTREETQKTSKIPWRFFLPLKSLCKRKRRKRKWINHIWPCPANWI